MGNYPGIFVFMFSSMLFFPNLQAAELEKYGTYRYQKPVPPASPQQQLPSQAMSAREQAILRARQQLSSMSPERRAAWVQRYQQERDRAASDGQYDRADYYDRILRGFEN